METVALRKAGYSIKMAADVFWNRFSLAFPPLSFSLPHLPFSRYGALSNINNRNKDGVVSFLKSYLEESLWAVGKTKLFLRDAGVRLPSSSSSSYPPLFV